jgi:hypothetical protein
MAVDLIPHLPLHELMDRALTDINSCEELYSRYLSGRIPGRAGENHVLREMAGEFVDAMVMSPRNTALSLDRPEPSIRMAALLLLRDYWPPRDWLTARCAQAAMSDPVAQVRGIALYTLLALSHHIVDASGLLRDLSMILTGREIHSSPTTIRDPATAQSTQHSDLRSDSIPSLTPEEIRADLQHISVIHLDEMLSDRNSTVWYLQDVHPELRCAALVILTRYWPFTQNAADLCERLLDTDDNVIVRQVAIEALATWYGKTDNVRVGGRLARIVHDVAQPTPVRDAAYQALFEIRGLPTTLWPTLRRMKGEFTFPEDVIWRFVDTFLPPSET